MGFIYLEEISHETESLDISVSLAADIPITTDFSIERALHANAQAVAPNKLSPASAESTTFSIGDDKYCTSILLVLRIGDEIATIMDRIERKGWIASPACIGT